MRRALAAIAALLMIVAAVLIRSRLDARRESADAGGGGNGSAKPTLVCVKELEKVCRELEARNAAVSIRVEEAATTLATLSAPEFDAASAKVDAWLAPRPLPEMVNDARLRRGLGPSLDDPSKVLARSPIVVTIWNDRLDALRSRCRDGNVNWRCIGDVSGEPWASAGGPDTWGDVRTALPRDESASGMLAMTEAAASFFGRPDFASNDFADPEFGRWFEQLARTSEDTLGQSGAAPIAEMLSKGPASVQIAAATEADAGPAIATSARKDRLTVLYPSPLVTADLVVAPVSGSRSASRVVKLVESGDAAAVLARNGWRVPGQSTVDGVRAAEPLPDTNGVPRPGVLLALRDYWLEVTR